MNRQFTICLVWFYILVIFIVWNHISSNQIQTAKIRQLKGNDFDGNASKNQKQSKKFLNQTMRNPYRSLHMDAKELRKLRDLVQRRLFHLQNPKNCTAAKKAICRPNEFGFGSGLHQVTFCLIVAYATERTLILNSRGWIYADEGWESVFLPVSTNCTSTMTKEKAYRLDLNGSIDKKVINLPLMQKLVYRPNYMPFAIPDDIADRLERVHRNPSIWWIGQLVDYLIRPNKKLKLYLKIQQNKLVFRRPIVGLHVRRTDKINEANYIGLEEYMEQVDKWFKEHSKNNSQTRYVFIATDTPNIIDEAKRKYPNYTFVYHEDAINMTKRSRYSKTSLRGLLLDVHTLVICDFVICTMTSNICRLVHELKESRDGREFEQLISLDTDYIFNQKFPGKRLERFVLENGTSGLDFKGFSVIKDKRKNPFRPLFTSDRPLSRVVMPIYPEVTETT